MAQPINLHREPAIDAFCALLTDDGTLWPLRGTVVSYFDA